MATWITLSEGRIDRECFSATKPEGTGWIEVSDDYGGRHGDKREWLDENFRRFGDDDELVRRGLRKDNRGRVFNINDRSNRMINDYDDELREDETKEPPLENEAYQKFDKAQKKWVVETEKKELAQKESEFAAIKAEMDDLDKKCVRHLRAEKKGRNDDSTKFNEYDSRIENVLRPKHDQLKAEIAVLKGELPLSA